MAGVTDDRQVARVEELLAQKVRTALREPYTLPTTGREGWMEGWSGGARRDKWMARETDARQVARVEELLAQKVRTELRSTTGREG